MILAGDVGGTKTILAYWDDPSSKEPAVVERFPSRDHQHFEDIVETFVGRHRPSVRAACFGIAGPIRNGKVVATNLPWTIDGNVVRQRVGGAPTRLINDLEANAHGIVLLDADDVCELQAGAPDAQGNRAIVSAGTGLGEAGLFWDGTTYWPFATEGGHADFAPKDDTEIDLLRYMMDRHPDHVSWERIVSGPGLRAVYEFLRDTGRGLESPAVAQRFVAEDPSAVISEHGLRGDDPLCVASLNLFIALYGAEAGNHALKIMSIGGLYIGGGVAPKNLAKMKDGTFLQAFLAKGRLRHVMVRMPVRIILNDRLALLGAARCARELLSASAANE